jgi:hypothetical protein
MTNANVREADSATVETDAVEALRPAGVSAEAWRAAVQKLQAEEAETARKTAAWEEPLGELADALGEDEKGSAGRLFIKRAEAQDWSRDDEIHDFVIDLLAALGWRQFHSTTHGTSWASQ